MFVLVSLFHHMGVLQIIIIVDSADGMAPNRWQGIILSDADISSSAPLSRTFIILRIEIWTFSMRRITLTLIWMD